jgi:hypothetical protein
MKKLFLLVACLIVLIAPLRAAGTPPEIIVVRIFENSGEATVIITRGEGKSEVKKFDIGFSDNKQIAGSEAYYKLLTGLYQEGFALQTTFTTQSNSSSSAVTLLFTKGH